LKIDPDILYALLERWPVARLATVAPDGRPHLVPVVFVAEAGVVFSPVDAKRKSSTALARLRNVEARGRGSLLIDHYDADWSRLWWVRLDGVARVEQDDAALLDRVARRLRAKYPQYRSVEPYAGTPTLLALRWERVRVWTQRGDTAPILRAVAPQ
jgi:PPOX class probable F420-dependent enzyme